MLKQSRSARPRLDRRGEDAALAHARARGAIPAARNFRGERCEVDLIIWDGPALAFAEVKTRRSGACGTPAESVTRAKARRYTRAALVFLQERGLPLETECRFDVFAVDASSGALEVEWIKGAFEAVELEPS